MKKFRIQNLIVHLLPDQSEVPNLAIIAGCPGAGPCSLNITDYTKDIDCDVVCDGCSKQPSGVCLPCTNITDIHATAKGPLDFALLKQQLQQALKNVEAAEQVMEEREQVRTVEDASVLEEHLVEALTELRNQKESLPPSDKKTRDNSPES